MKYVVRTVYLLTLLLLLMPCSGYGSDLPVALRVGICEARPFCFTDADGTPRGLYPDLINHIAAQEQWDVTFVSGTWEQGLERLQREEIDLITAIAFSPERSLTMDFNRESVFEEWGQVFVKQGSPIRSIEDLKGKRVGVTARDISGINFRKTAQKLGITCHIKEYPSSTAVFAAIRAGQVSAGVATQLNGLYRSHGPSLAPSPIQFSPFSIAFAAKRGLHGDRLATLDRYLSRWKKRPDSYYDKRLAHWTGLTAYEKTVTPRWPFLAVVVIAMGSAMLVYLNRALKRTVQHRTRELQYRKKQYKDLVESANSIILRMDKYGRVLFLNRFGLDLFGYSREEIYGRNVLGTILSPEAARALHITGHDTEAFDLLETQALIENENTCKDGRTVYIQWSNRAITDDLGRFQEILSIGIDISQRRQLETSLYQAQKMEAIGTLAGGIAHDFNNILTVIFGYTELAQLYIHSPEKIKEALEQISQGGIRAKELVSQILTFSRKSEPEKQPLQPLLIIKETVKLLRPSLPSTIRIESIIKSKSIIHADPTQIHQVIMNLCTNAYHAMETTGGTLRVALTDTSINAPGTMPGELPQVLGEYILLEVTDTGCGIEPGLMPHIYDPYFTTKEKGKGTGLGLSVVKAIVKEHQGHICAKSLPGKGTTFKVFLPRFKSKVKPILPGTRRAQVSGDNETILVVDDEKKITDSLSDLLSLHGYTPRPFTDGASALACFKEAPDTIDLVLSDVTMPGMTGTELTRQMTAIRPELPVLLFSGYSEPMARDELTDLGNADYLQKPMDTDTLLTKIRTQLTRGTDATGTPPVKTAS
ncbi:PAS domain S-box-containing protein [Desulfoluna spongiiphila]|uniref:histidine kinase n=1 Tax=Desulfoluna spongiiphila TaxID=419481 RepID=A0A1G5HCB8_9BACT|nr:PAS domain S-box-containing protein [Desulfoluna spongiiphila]